MSPTHAHGAQHTGVRTTGMQYAATQSHLRRATPHHRTMQFPRHTTFASSAGGCGITNLTLLSAPYYGSTADCENNFARCGRGKEAIFTLEVPPGHVVVIGQTESSYDSRHELSWGSGSFPGGTVVACIDDPDLKMERWVNTELSSQRIFFVVDSYSRSGSGPFTLTWSTGGQQSHHPPFIYSAG